MKISFKSVRHLENSGDFPVKGKKCKEHERQFICLNTSMFNLMCQYCRIWNPFLQQLNLLQSTPGFLDTPLYQLHLKVAPHKNFQRKFKVKQDYQIFSMVDT